MCLLYIVTHSGATCLSAGRNSPPKSRISHVIRLSRRLVISCLTKRLFKKKNIYIAGHRPPQQHSDCLNEEMKAPLPLLFLFFGLFFSSVCGLNIQDNFSCFYNVSGMIPHHFCDIWTAKPFELLFAFMFLIPLQRSLVNLKLAFYVLWTRRTLLVYSTEYRCTVLPLAGCFVQQCDVFSLDWTGP